VRVLVVVGFHGASRRYILSWSVLETYRGWDYLRDCDVEKEISFLGLCRLMGKRFGWLNCCRRHVTVFNAYLSCYSGLQTPVGSYLSFWTHRLISGMACCREN
jgi:hypothetical protein